MKRQARDFRKKAKGTVNLSTYVDDLQTLTIFLHSRQGWKPFQLQQDNNNYICPKWTITYSSGNKGTIQLEMTRYLNPT